MRINGSALQSTIATIQQILNSPSLLLLNSLTYSSLDVIASSNNADQSMSIISGSESDGATLYLSPPSVKEEPATNVF